jgi:hypothetical protein
MKNRHDQRVHAKPTQIVAGDSVRIRLPAPGHKLAPVYSDPIKVLRTKDNTVWTDDGKRWNVRRCIRVQSAMHQRHVDERRPVVLPVEFSHRVPDDSGDTTPSDDAAPRGEETDVNGGAPASHDVRRSSRHRRATDFGPFVLFD